MLRVPLQARTAVITSVRDKDTAGLFAALTQGKCNAEIPCTNSIALIPPYIV